MIPRAGREYMAAIESQLQALAVMRVVKMRPSEAWKKMLTANDFLIGAKLLPVARPFFWAKDPTAAVLALAEKIPLDAQLNEWNLSTTAVWWHFDEPLQVQTVIQPDPLKALCMGMDRPRVCRHLLGVDEPSTCSIRSRRLSTRGEGRRPVAVASLVLDARRDHR